MKERESATPTEADSVITRQPQSCTNAVGTTATFTVAATGTESLAYLIRQAHYDLESCPRCSTASEWGRRNSKSEIRRPEEIQNSKRENSRP